VGSRLVRAAVEAPDARSAADAVRGLVAGFAAALR
jgi:hypothetical protein